MSDRKIIGVLMLLHRFTAFFLVIGYFSLLVWLSCYRKNKIIAFILIFALLVGFYIIGLVANKPCEE